jgi:pimeloyl-ACP methyl ester carboxylesterase
MFQKLQLPVSLSVIHLDWIDPLYGETLPDYSRRIAGGINTSDDFVLVGLSFGGMIATEISQIVQPKQTIIISSAGSRRELPWFFRLAGILKLDLLLSPSFLKRPNFFTYWIFGAKTKGERLLLDQILKDTSPSFLKWSIRSILSWDRREKPTGIFHIHGLKDKILPVQYVKADIIVPAGRHLMVYSLAETISRLITERLGNS